MAQLLLVVEVLIFNTDVEVQEHSRIASRLDPWALLFRRLAPVIELPYLLFEDGLVSRCQGLKIIRTIEHFVFYMDSKSYINL